MRNFLFFLLLFISSLLEAQKLVLLRETLPSIIVDGEDTVGVGFSLTDAREIDKKLEVLHYTEILNGKIDTMEFNYITLINDLKVKNTLFKNKIVSFISENGKKDEIISNLNRNIALCDEQSSLKDSIISNNEKTIKTLKKEKKIFIFGGAALVVLLLLK